MKPTMPARMFLFLLNTLPAFSVAQPAERVALPAVRVYRNEHEPLVGLDAAIAYLKGAGPVGNWRSEAVRSSGDFGYSYGLVSATDDTPQSTAAFVHVWKRVDGTWRLLLDLLIPMQ